MYSKGDVKDMRERLAKESLNGQRGQMEYLVQAEVKMELLTGNPHWDIFLSYIQFTLDGLNSRLSQARDALCSPATVNPDLITSLKLEIAEVGGMVKSMEAVLSLPKGIMEEGEKARERLNGL